LTLGCGSAGGGSTSDNVSPMNLINIRKVGYGVRKLEDIAGCTQTGETAQSGINRCYAAQDSKVSSQNLKELLEKLLEQLT
jgi:acetaldehyde dehydrogenase (acetylating)